ncbi:MAG: hypothetical protein GYA71_09305, partial [Bacteroidales bacterium]|nr:hypothetical protein [Bacteroidales bacterium]
MRKIIIISAIVLLGISFSCSEDYLEPTLAQEKAVETSIKTTEDIQGILYAAYD